MSRVTSLRSVHSGESMSLSDLASRHDADPLLAPDLDAFVDMFDDGELEDILDQVGEIDFDIEELQLDDIGGQDFIDIFKAFEMDTPEVDNTRPKLEQFEERNYHNIPSGNKKEATLITHTPLSYPMRFWSDEGSRSVMMGNEHESLIVGHSKAKTSFVFDVKSVDYYKIANQYAEEVGGKGVNLGFSSFLHSVIVLIFARNTDGVVEPYEGEDYAFDGILVEVTGQGYKERKTKADVVINKYLVASASLSNLPCHKQYLSFSWAEDTGRMTQFYGTAFDNVETERSPIMKSLAGKIHRITNDQRRVLGNNYITYCFKQGIPENDVHVSNRDFSETIPKIKKLIEFGSKQWEGNLYAPSPFRVLYPQRESESLTYHEIERRQKHQIFVTQEAGCTYHTWPIEKDPRSKLRETTEKYPESSVNIHISIHDALAISLKKYKVYTYAVIQAALLPKINGKGGCFYDKYNRVGVSWWRKNASSLKWICQYYTFSYPGDQEDIGKWYFRSDDGIYVSPTFVVSRQDIHYASVLPAKVSSALSSIRTLLDPDVYKKTEPLILMAMGIQNDSTWMTSHRCDANRFLTCCHVSSSGDLPALIEGQLKEGNKHRFCDYFQLMLFLAFINERPGTNVTPLLRLPFAILAYEKDFSQTLQWHMRDTNHSTECMRKISDAARGEMATYEEYKKWMEIQDATIDKMLANGLTRQEYIDYMDSSPSFPHLNILAFIGMTNIVSDELSNIGSVQHAVGLSIWSLITDRHCIEYKGKKGGMHVVKSSKVVESMYNLLRKFGSLSGMYELIMRMSQGEKLPPNLLLNHYKDAKGGDREISQMMPEHRTKQAIPEALTETFTGSHEDDMMSDPAKYNKHVLSTMTESARGKSMHGSEDRSKFCHEQDPQSQGLCLGIISHQVGSTCLRTAAAMTMMNKTREIVYPHDAHFDELLDDLDSENMVIEDRISKSFTKKITTEKGLPENAHETKKITIEKNMTQGLGAITAGAINTVFVQAHAKIFDMMVPGFRTIAANTTSDDVKRSGSNESVYDHDQVFRLYREIPNRNIHMCMMKENMKKPIFSRTLSEFNNVVATTSGMVSQAPIFATLTIQPLLSKSLFGDLSTVVNTTRSTLTWGCPPDTIQSSMYAMLRVFQQKWLLDENEMDTIWLAGLLPRDINEHIEGFWVRNRDTLRRLVSLVPEELRSDVSTGSVPIYDALRRAELDLGKRRKKKRMEIKDIEGLGRANKVKETILSQRLVAENLMTRHIPPIHPTVRHNAKKAFFSMLAIEDRVDDINDIEAMRPQRVTYSVRAARKADRIPCSLGTSSRLPAHSIQRLRAARYLNVKYRDHLSEDEARIMQLPDEDFEKKILQLERAPKYQGFSFKSPVGKPFTRLFDNKIMKRPAAFDFSVDLDHVPSIRQPFTYKGVPVRNFRPCMYGGFLLTRFQRDFRSGTDVIAFGHGYVNKIYTLFYHRNSRGSEIQTLQINEKARERPYNVQRTSGGKIYYALRFDNTPIPSYMHESNVAANLPGVIGDDTAIQNYGNYCRSASPDGFRIYQALFKKFSSKIPNHVINNMPPYPYFMGKTVDIDRGRITSLSGYNSVLKLKLSSNETDKELVNIDLTGMQPQEIIVTFDEEMLDLDYDSGNSEEYPF